MWGRIKVGIGATFRYDLNPQDACTWNETLHDCAILRRQRRQLIGEMTGVRWFLDAGSDQIKRNSKYELTGEIVNPGIQFEALVRQV